ncbi:MAG: hypothetical protein RR334_03590 [Clostridia bacterium]
MKKKIFALSLCLLCLCPLALVFSACGNTSYVATISVAQNAGLGKISLSDGSGNSVPNEVTITNGNSYSINITANTGARIQKIEVNGVEELIGRNYYKYTFTNLTSNVSFKVYFEKDTVNVIFYDLLGNRIDIDGKQSPDGAETFIWGDHYKFPPLANVKWYAYKEAIANRPETMKEYTTNDLVCGNESIVSLYARAIN